MHEGLTYVDESTKRWKISSKSVHGKMLEGRLAIHC